VQAGLLLINAEVGFDSTAKRSQVPNPFATIRDLFSRGATSAKDDYLQELIELKPPELVR
jgi:hypothetical protein